VVNFGIPDLAGAAVAGIDVTDLQRRLRDALVAFEPRLTPSTLRVIVGSDTDRMDQRSLTFRIESEMWAQPLPLNLYLKSEVDLETGGVNVTEGAG
jgi:type VI secretion system protein ImpF